MLAYGVLAVGQRGGVHTVVHCIRRHLVEYRIKSKGTYLIEGYPSSTVEAQNTESGKQIKCCMFKAEEEIVSICALCGNFSAHPIIAFNSTIVAWHQEKEPLAAYSIKRLGLVDSYTRILAS